MKRVYDFRKLILNAKTIVETKEFDGNIMTDGYVAYVYNDHAIIITSNDLRLWIDDDTLYDNGDEYTKVFMEE